MVKTFCGECLIPVDAKAVAVSETVAIRGVGIEVVNEYPVCPQCGSCIGDPVFAEANLSRAYDAYRKTEGIPTPDQIRALRDRAGWSQRQLACLLGIGLASLQRYEGGSLPTESHATLMKRVFDPSFLRGRLREIATSLSEMDYADLSWGIDAAFGSGWDSAAYYDEVPLSE